MGVMDLEHKKKNFVGVKREGDTEGLIIPIKGLGDNSIQDM
jgi:hypothetical protein